jgi:hypothetical protein
MRDDRTPEASTVRRIDNAVSMRRLPERAVSLYPHDPVQGERPLKYDPVTYGIAQSNVAAGSRVSALDDAWTRSADLLIVMAVW